ncbi:MAG: shikimate dehydrogenase, partial [Thermomonas sp.]
MRKHHAVFGTPISHSLSPRIHAAFARQCGIELDYLAIEADAGDFRAKLDDFAAHGGTGANVTLPLKEAAFALCSEASERARRAGAVNTLVRAGDGWHGDNTDGAGLVRDLTGRHMLDLRARRTLLLGAGGAARGIAPALLEAGIGELTIVNRTPERADALADALGEPGRVHPRYLGDLAALGEFDLIVNATSAARGGQLPALPRSLVGRRCAAVDLSYGEAAIPFLAWARANGCHDAVDGLGMLVEQAA